VDRCRICDQKWEKGNFLFFFFAVEGESFLMKPTRAYGD
jgi:hypothetical protein